MSYKQNHLANAIKTKKIKVREKERGRMKWKKMRNSIDETRECKNHLCHFNGGKTTLVFVLNESLLNTMQRIQNVQGS